jgi:hypothetical protein
MKILMLKIIYKWNNIQNMFLFLGTFAKLRKATIRFTMCVRRSAGPHGITRIPLKEFLRYFTLKEFSKIYRKNTSFIKA